MSNLKNQKFSYDVSTIGGYSDQVGGELLAKALIGVVIRLNGIGTTATGSVRYGEGTASACIGINCDVSGTGYFFRESNC